MSKISLRNVLTYALLMVAACVPETPGIDDTPPAAAQPALETERHASAQVLYRSIQIEGQTVSYREAGKRGRPVLLFLHGFPTSSHMYRNLIGALAEECASPRRSGEIVPECDG